MEMRRQVTVSWDSGGSDEAPPKVRQNDCHIDLLLFLNSPFYKQKHTVMFFLSVSSPVDQVTQVLAPVKASSPAPNTTTSR